jgi:hypothetical protein
MNSFHCVGMGWCYIDGMGADPVSLAAMPPKSNNVQRSVRFPESYLPRLEAVAAALSRPGIEVTATDAIRYALELGLVAAEKELGLAGKPPAAAPKKPK